MKIGPSPLWGGASGCNFFYGRGEVCAYAAGDLVKEAGDKDIMKAYNTMLSEGKEPTRLS